MSDDDDDTITELDEGTDAGLDDLEPAPPARKPQGWAARKDWPRIKAMYVEGLDDPSGGPDGKRWPSLDECARAHDTNPTAVRTKAAADGWREARAAYQTHVERVRQQRRAEAGAAELKDLDSAALRAAKLGVGLAVARLSQIGAAHQAAREANAPSVIDARELDALAKAADLFHRIGLRSLGDVEGTTRMEVTGAGGNAIEIAAELRRDDPARLTGVLQVLHLAGLGDVFGPNPAALASTPAAQGRGGDAVLLEIEAGD